MDTFILMLRQHAAKKRLVVLTLSNGGLLTGWLQPTNGSIVTIAQQASTGKPMDGAPNVLRADAVIGFRLLDEEPTT